MNKRSLIAILIAAFASIANADLRFGLGSAVAHRSANLINEASEGQSGLNSTLSGCANQRTGKIGSASFTVAPLDVTTDVTAIIPLGNLNPPGHTFPTDHMYFYYTGVAITTADPISSPNPHACDGGCPVHAIADGYLSEIVTDIENGVVQYKVTFTYTDTFASYFDHVITLDPSIAAQAGSLPPTGTTCEWIPVKAGQVIGSVGGVGGENALDLGVTNLQIAQPFITPSHYSYGIYSDAPLKYYVEPLRSTLYAMVERTTPDYLGSSEKDGIFCFDVPNTIQGNWAAQGSDSLWTNSDTWDQELSIAYDPVYANQIRITFGGMNGTKSFGLIGSWMVQPGAAAPASITVGSGAYGYQIYGWDPNYGTIDLNSGPGGAPGPHGLLMLQLLNNDALKAEYFSGTDPSVTRLPFDSNAVIYVR
jgi:hypothetical protein